MKRIATVLAVLTIIATAGTAQVPQLVHYQGRVTVGGTNFTGSGQFKFALVNAGATATYWSNGNTAVSLAVSNGLYAVLLGDTGQLVIPAAVFTNSDVRLRVQFNDGVAGFQTFSPDQRLAAVGYALMAASHDPTADVTAQRLKIGTGHVLTGNLATIAGGSNNLAIADLAVVGGGMSNRAVNTAATVAGGEQNIASIHAAVGGGFKNQAVNTYTTIAGGYTNYAYGVAATVGGGQGNVVTNNYATIPGGFYNLAGGQFSFAGGYGAQARHNGAFVWSDSTGASQVSTAPDQFLIRATGGVGINTNNTAGGALTVGGNVVAGGFVGGGTALTGVVPADASVTSAKIVDGAIVNTDINAAAAIADTKLATISTAGKVANSALSASVSLLGQSIESAEITDGTIATADIANIDGGKIVGGDLQAARLKVGFFHTLNGNYSTIAGGDSNSTGTDYGSVGGGYGNYAQGAGATVAGGGYAIGIYYGNNAGGEGSAIGGGIANTTPGQMATVAGGRDNHATNDYATATGGAFNYGGGVFAFIGGGLGNAAVGYATTIGGGTNNIASGAHATVAGGRYNLASATDAFIGGGQGNIADDGQTVVAGGFQNRATGDNYATVGGGFQNLAGNYAATVSGGGTNSASADYSTVPGGRLNTASGVYSFAAGLQAKALHHGAFVWADAQGLDFASTTNNQFAIRANGGLRLNNDTSLFCGDQTRQMVNLWGTLYGIGVQAYTMYFRVDDFGGGGGYAWYKGGTHNDAQFNAGGGTQLMRLESTGNLYTAGSVNPPSDRDLKEDFQPVDVRRVLEKVAGLPVTTWRYKTATTERHLGPVAQDFHAAFGVGPDDKHIATVDADGVALAAIQGLFQELQEEKARNTELEKRLAEIERKLTEGGK